MRRQESTMFAVQRHKIVKRSKLPFNTLLRELKDVVKEYHSPNIMEKLCNPANLDQLIVSQKVQRKLRARNINRVMLCAALTNGNIVPRTSSQLFTSTPGGGVRLLTPRETKSGTKFVKYSYDPDNFFNKTTLAKRCQLNADADSSSTKKCLCVRYIRKSRKKPYIIVDAYIQN